MVFYEENDLNIQGLPGIFKWDFISFYLFFCWYKKFVGNSRLIFPLISWLPIISLYCPIAIKIIREWSNIDVQKFQLIFKIKFLGGCTMARDWSLLLHGKKQLPFLLRGKMWTKPLNAHGSHLFPLHHSVMIKNSTIGSIKL